MSPRTLPLADVRLVEQAEGDYLRRFLDGAPAAVRATAGIRTARIGGGVLTAMAEDPSHYWSKAVGLGFDTPVDQDLLTAVTAFFRGAGVSSALVALAPHVLPDDWETAFPRLGLEPVSQWAKLVCPVDDLVPGSTDLEVRALTAADVPGWVRIVREAFGMVEPDLTPMLRGVFDDADARAFGAFDGDLLVGAGAVHVVGEVASVNTGGTLPSHRGRGVQSALVTARARAAVAAGCRLLTAETGGATDDPSYRNLVRAGFGHGYDRTNWRWTA